MKNFEQEYNKFVTSSTPDYWSKIEGKIESLDSNSKKVIRMSDIRDNKKKKERKPMSRGRRIALCSMVACLCLTLVVGWQFLGKVARSGRNTIESLGTGTGDSVGDVGHVDYNADYNPWSDTSDSSSSDSGSSGDLAVGSGDASDGSSFSFDVFSRTPKTESSVDEPAPYEPVAPETYYETESYDHDYDDYSRDYDKSSYERSGLDGYQQVSSKVLTAGEWKDNDNWRFFESIVNDGLVDFPSFGLDPRYRIKVHVTDGKGKSVAGVEVTLRGNSVYHSNYEDDGFMPNRGHGYDTIWTSVTNKDGIAYLFAEKPNATELFVDVRKADNYFDIYPVTMCDNVINGSPNYKSSGSNVPDPFSSINSSSIFNDIEATTNLDSSKSNKLQVMFIIDTTGSMDDEIDFLKKDFSAIAKDVDPGQSYVEYGVVLYRDEGDEYVTKSFDFTRNVSSVQNYINGIEADGGGDAPEAVDEALSVAFSDELSWDYDSNKVAFLIFDAPPHDGTDYVINNVVKEISGFVHVVPVLASTSDRDAEMFGRALGIMTDGSYVFLTDDSGVGDSHMKPIIGNYDVELLHDVIVRIINEYK